MAVAHSEHGGDASPTDAGVLAGRLGLGRGAQGAATRAMLGELMAAIWQLRSV